MIKIIKQQDKTLRAKHKVNQIFKRRLGKTLGLTLQEFCFLYFGTSNVTEERKVILRSIRKMLKNERLRNIIPEHISNKNPITLDDTELPKGEDKLGIRKDISGWIYYQPDFVNDAEKYRSFCDSIAHSIEKSGELSVDLAREQEIREETINIVSKI